MALTSYLARYGARLLGAGYDVVPVSPGVKYPRLEGWQRVEVTPAVLRRWLANGHAQDGVGIRTARTPAIDLDILDPVMASRMERWCHAHLGFAPVRTGRAPKRLLVFRAETPFAKRQSAWVDREGQQHKVEILGDGQQFVGWHIHPETGKPYAWSDDSLLTVAHDDLPVLTDADAAEALAMFDRLAAEAGWQRKTALLDASPVALSGDLWETVLPSVDIADDELRQLLMAIREWDDYDAWLQIGMALYHHFHGGEDGLILWHEWSAQSAKYDAETLDRKWPTFSRLDGAARTARTIIAKGRAALREQTERTIGTLKTRLSTATTAAALRAAAADAATQKMDNLDRESLSGALRSAWRRLEGAPLPIALARAMLRYKAPETDAAAKPAWLDGWYYLTHDDTFYDAGSGEAVTRSGFDARFNRRLMTAADREQGRAAPEVTASVMALNVWRIRAVTNRLYLPTEPLDFTLNGLAYVNAYRDSLVPEVPDKPTPRDARNVARVQEHFANLFVDDRERLLLLSLLAYVVQTGRRVNWAALIQGTEGDGKSFVVELMGAVLGGDNVKTIATATLETGFTGWAAGSQIAFVEEVKLQGHNRHDVLNSIKPLITNATVVIHPKGVDPYQAPNTQTYVLLTNYADALPLGENDSRYFVLRTRFQRRDVLRAFEAAHPTYFRDLFAAVDESPGALRGWLLSLPLHVEFDPRARAPWSAGRDHMVSLAASPESETVAAVLADSKRWDLRRDLLTQEALIDETLAAHEEVLTPWKARRILTDGGWTFVGRYAHRGGYVRVWTQTPEKWRRAVDGVETWDRSKVGERLTLDL